MKPNELIIPPVTEKDPNAQEICRCWVAAGDLHVSLSPDSFDDPSAWGVVLADIAQHVANAYSQTKGLEKEVVLKSIKRIFEAEWENGTETPVGEVIDI